MGSDPTLEAIAAAGEVSIETTAGARTSNTIVWVVEVAGVLYVRSFLGSAAKWYRRVVANPRVALVAGSHRVEFTAAHVTDPDVIASVSDAFLAKYPPGRSRDAMVRDEVLDTTLRLEPD